MPRKKNTEITENATPNTPIETKTDVILTEPIISDTQTDTQTAEKLPQIIPVEPQITTKPTGIEWNYESVQSYLNQITEKYQNLVVTDENFDDMTKTKSEIVHLRTSLQKFEVQGKRILKQPTTDFTNECAKLYKIISGVENPLEEQLQVFEDKRVAQVSADINGEFTKKAEAAGIREEFTKEFQIVDKWLNKTAKWGDTVVAIDQEVARILTVQKESDDAIARHAERREFAGLYIEKANMQYNLKSPLDPAVEITDELLDMTVTEIKAKIFETAEERHNIELAAMKHADVPPAMEPPEIPVINPAVMDITMPSMPPINEYSAPPTNAPMDYKDMVITMHRVNMADYDRICMALDTLAYRYDVELKG